MPGPDSQLQIRPDLPIPDYLRGEIQSKLAYVDEHITRAVIPEGGEQIILYTDLPLDQPGQVALEEKVQRVVASTVKGAFKPKVQVLEDHLDRPLNYQTDPMIELVRRGEISQEAIFAAYFGV